MRRSLILVTALLSVCRVSFGSEVDDHLLSGSKFLQDKKMSEAIREFETAVNLDPENARANLLLGLALEGQNDLEKAVAYLEKSASSQPSYSAYYNLGLSYASLSQLDKSMTSFEKAAEINTKSYEAFHQLGKVRAASLQFEKAIEAYRQAASLNAKFPDAYQGMGSAYYWSGDLTLALQQVDELNKLGFESHARQLERWIKDKEAKKKKKA